MTNPKANAIYGVLIVFFLIFNPIYAFDNETCTMNENCHLPNCNCDSKDIPVNFTGKFRIDELPQIVVLTIDDEALNIESYQVYRRLFSKFKNPNGCPIKATFFLADNDNRTSFCLVRNLYERRHEIAITTLNNTCPRKACQSDPEFRSWTYQTWLQQILEMRNRLKYYAAIPNNEIIGFRAPLTEPAADMHYRIIASHRFLYDSSLITNDRQIYWPFTLNFRLNVPLWNNGPIRSYRGLWELPIPINLNKRNGLCGKLWEDPCEYDSDEMGTFFRKHMLRAYYNNRAPIVFHLNSRWLKRSVKIMRMQQITRAGRSNTIEKFNATVEKKEFLNLRGLIKFINQTTTSNKNVYFLTAQQAIHYMRVLPRLENARVNLSEFIQNEILENCTHIDSLLGEENMNELDKYDGKCDFLNQAEPDYDEDETIYLDDDEESDKRSEKVRIQSSKVTSWQSENLFVNSSVSYFVLFLGLLIIILVSYDRFSKKKIN